MTQSFPPQNPMSLAAARAAAAGSTDAQTAGRVGAAQTGAGAADPFDGGGARQSAAAQEGFMSLPQDLAERRPNEPHLPQNRSAQTHRPKDLLAQTLLPESLAQLRGFKPRHRSGSRWLAYLPLLAWLVQQQRPKQLVALGLGSGTAYFTLCQAAADLPPGNDMLPRLYGIDLGQAPAAQDAAQDIGRAEDAAAQTAPLPSAAAQPALPRLSEALLRLNAAYAPQSRLICADPKRAHRAFDPGTSDMLLVDLPLDAELLAHIAKDWLPLMSPQGLILLVGTNAAQEDPQSKAILRQMMADAQHLALPLAGGMLALAPGAMPPPAFAELAADAPDSPERAALTELLRQIAEPLLLQEASQAAEQKLQALEAALDAAKEAATQDLAALTRLAEQSRIEAEQKGRDLAQAVARNAALEADLTELRAARLNDSRELAAFARLCETHRSAAAAAATREARLRDELAQMAFHLDGTRAEVTALRQSTSWRVTAPLRRAITLLRPKRG